MSHGADGSHRRSYQSRSAASFPIGQELLKQLIRHTLRLGIPAGLLSETEQILHSHLVDFLELLSRHKHRNVPLVALYSHRLALGLVEHCGEVLLGMSCGDG